MKKFVKVMLTCGLVLEALALLVFFLSIPFYNQIITLFYSSPAPFPFQSIPFLYFFLYAFDLMIAVLAFCIVTRQLKSGGRTIVTEILSIVFIIVLHRLLSAVLSSVSMMIVGNRFGEQALMGASFMLRWFSFAIAPLSGIGLELLLVGCGASIVWKRTSAARANEL